MHGYPLKEKLDFRLEEGILEYLQEIFDAEAGGEGHRIVLFLCNPNNPDGRNIPQTLLEEILAWCACHGAGLFLDECFLDMSDHPDSMKPFLSDHPELFLLKAFTKNYGMAGIRLGYGLCSDSELLSAMSRLSQPWNVSIPAQAAGIAAVREKSWIRKARELIRTERARMTKELQDLGFRVCASEANFLQFLAK